LWQQTFYCAQHALFFFEDFIGFGEMLYANDRFHGYLIKMFKITKVNIFYAGNFTS